MRETGKRYLLHVAEMLEKGLIRENGNLQDDPEGTNYVRLSDTLTKELARGIREAVLDD